MDAFVRVLQNKVIITTLKKHQLPPLKYDYAALEPYVESRTINLHHDFASK